MRTAASWRRSILTFFNVKEFPGVELVGITRAQQERNTAAFRRMIALAHERGIEITAGIWDHIYRGGVQGGGIPGASQNAGKRVPGLVFGVTAENLAPYTKAALKRFLEVFPEMDAIQFRMHDESGLKKEEIPVFWHDVFASIKENHPNLRLDLRSKGLPDEVIDDALAQHLKAKISTKFWMEQMGLPFHPTHTNTEDQKNRRHSYADLLAYPQRYRVHWQLWSGGTTRLLLWGDPDYVRRFAESAKLYDGDSFEVNEMLATRMLGEPHDEKPLDIINPSYRYYDYEFERYWEFYRLFGRLTYNPKAAPDSLGARVHVALRGAGGGTDRARPGTRQPRAAANRGSQLSLLELPDHPRLGGDESPGQPAGVRRRTGQRHRAVHECPRRGAQHHRRQRYGDASSRRRPAAGSPRQPAQILVQVDQAGPPSNKEFRSTVTDLKILAGLARYHSRRLLAGVSLQPVQGDGQSARHSTKPLRYEKKAPGGMGPDRRRRGRCLQRESGLRRARRRLQPPLEGRAAVARAQFRATAGRAAKAVARPGAKHYSLHEVGEAPSATLTAKGLEISARVQAAKSVRLRYRHTTQYEDYQTAEMTLDAKSGLYVGRIPAGFASPKWSLTYFVEVVDQKGNGRIFPDLDTETPYRVVAPQ